MKYEGIISKKEFLTVNGMIFTYTNIPDLINSSGGDVRRFNWIFIDSEYESTPEEFLDDDFDGMVNGDKLLEIMKKKQQLETSCRCNYCIQKNSVVQ